MMWSVSLLKDPLKLGPEDPVTGNALRHTCIVHASCSGSDLFANQEIYTAVMQEGGRVARVALADFVARKLARSYYQDSHIRFEPLDRTTIHRRPKTNSRMKDAKLTPFILERTDAVACQADNRLHVYLRVFVLSCDSDGSETTDHSILQAASGALQRLVDLKNSAVLASFLNHISTAVLQDKLRSVLGSLNAVAFVADGAILPRKSGASSAPMASPPAIPFAAPENSPMNQTVKIDMGKLYPYIVDSLPQRQPEENGTTTVVSLQGLLIPRGVSLIVGGGYHGKSTLLRCLAAGVFNKIPGDGREFCVTVDDAVTVRAEDGRYVNQCNVSAFISNLPCSIDTKRFSTGEASGSTSQAANVVEAMEMGASALLVDEDVSAANFMARDGRMRSLVMDESITPLLYRVNGLFATHGISSIVVVGGVGDWLDVPDTVVLMDRYLCKDATAKARSISKQFSHGHVQYAGRGVVHRLNWEKTGTPIPRRPDVASTETSASRYNFQMDKTAVTLLDGSESISLQQITADDQQLGKGNDDDAMSVESSDDEDERYIDMSRCEQLMGKKPQLYGCGLCVVWLLEAARRHPELGLPDLLRKMDKALDEKGLLAMIVNDSIISASWNALVENLGCAYRPRRFEAGQALTRLRGIVLEAIPVEDDGSEEAAKVEAERKKNELLAIWNNRRTNPLEHMNSMASSSEDTP
jgi:Predicted ATPase of the ABC class